METVTFFTVEKIDQQSARLERFFDKSSLCKWPKNSPDIQCILKISPLCHTLSKALDLSKKTPLTSQESGRSETWLMFTGNIIFSRIFTTDRQTRNGYILLVIIIGNHLFFSRFIDWSNIWFFLCKFVILIDCINFLSQFLDVTRMSMSAVSFLVQVDSGIFCL